jgi:hypothetical protein
MGKYTDEFKKPYGQDRQDTRTEIESVRAGGEIRRDYSYKIACETMFVSILFAILAGAYVWQFNDASLFMTLIVALVTWIVTGFLLTMLFVLFFGMQGKLAQSVLNKREVQDTIPLAASESSQESTKDPLSEQEEMYLFQCLAIVGSGSYALRGSEQQQVTILHSTLSRAKESGADWKRIYSAVYNLWAAKRSLLPTIRSARPTITQRIVFSLGYQS